MSDWQPIETAPKDGSDILVFDCWKGVNPVHQHIDYEYARVVQVYWYADHVGFDWPNNKQVHGRWMPRTDARPQHYTTVEVHPIAWMPLPEPPA